MTQQTWTDVEICSEALDEVLFFLKNKQMLLVDTCYEPDTPLAEIISDGNFQYTDCTEVKPLKTEIVKRAADHCYVDVTCLEKWDYREEPTEETRPVKVSFDAEQLVPILLGEVYNPRKKFS